MPCFGGKKGYLATKSKAEINNKHVRVSHEHRAHMALVLCGMALGLGAPRGEFIPTEIRL